MNSPIFFIHPGKHEEKQEEGGIVTKNFTKKIQWVEIVCFPAVFLDIILWTHLSTKVPATKVEVN